jgi:hypothetical protein
MSRVWDRLLTDQDRELLRHRGDRRKGIGTRPALLLVDLYRWVFGDEPEPLLTAVQRWPGRCGPAGWAALPHIQRLLEAARGARIPVIHVTGLEEIVGWRDRRRMAPSTRIPARTRRNGADSATTSSARSPRCRGNQSCGSQRRAPFGGPRSSVTCDTSTSTR